MFFKSLRAAASVYSIVVLGAAFVPSPTRAQPDSLRLQAPSNVFVVPVMGSDRQRFVNYVFWQDIPDSVGSYIHPPDTLGWNPKTSSTPQSALSVPSSSGFYNGTIDRTITFLALRNGVVGTTPTLELRFDIVAEENYSGRIRPGAGYTPGEPIPCIFREQDTQEPLDLGLRVHFSPGRIDSNGTFIVGLEDFEGFHVWRGIDDDGGDLSVITELSKQEQFSGQSAIDELYFDAIIPALRADGTFDFGFSVPGLGSRIDLTNIHPNGKLGPNELAWFDFNAFNGFTYQYVVTTFDRSYKVRSHAQGLIKYDNCTVTQGVAFPCPSNIVTAATQVSPQNTMREIYAVPNPYRTGSTQFSAPNYHNYPDNKVRFVNVPSDCEVRIYTLSGDLVQTLQNRGGTGVVEWDARNRGGEDVSSGVYIFRVEKDTGESMYGRLVVIR